MHNPYMLGSLPTELGLLTKLGTLKVGKVRFSGTIPTELGLTDIFELNLDSARFTGTLPTELGNLDILFMCARARKEERATQPRPACEQQHVRACTSRSCLTSVLERPRPHPATRAEQQDAPHPHQRIDPDREWKDEQPEDAVRRAPRAEPTAGTMHRDARDPAAAVRARAILQRAQRQTSDHPTS
jgi:hypothetical protein